MEVLWKRGSGGENFLERNFSPLTLSIYAKKSRFTFFLANFFDFFIFYYGGENFLSRKFSPPDPLFQRTFKKRALFFSRYLVRSTVKRTMFAQTKVGKFWSSFSLKACGYLGQSPKSLSAESETILFPSQNAGKGEFLCRAKEEGEPSSAMSLS